MDLPGRQAIGLLKIIFVCLPVVTGDLADRDQLARWVTEEYLSEQRLVLAGDIGQQLRGWSLQQAPDQRLFLKQAFALPLAVQLVDALDTGIARRGMTQGPEQFVMVGPAFQVLGRQLAQIMGLRV